MRRSNWAIVVLTLMMAAPAAGQLPYFETRNLQAVVDGLDVVDMQGKRWTAADLRGRVVLLDFWATWCAPCLAQIPELRRLRSAYGDRFEVLAISLDSRSRRDLIAWLNRQNITWPQVHDGRAFNGPAARPFGVRALPASLLVVDGKIAAQNVRGAKLEAAVAALAAAK